MIYAEGWDGHIMSRLISCKHCGRVHPANYDCGKRPVKRYERKESERGRYTRAWRNKSNEIKDRAHYLCEYCLSQDMCVCDDLETHHIIKLTDRPDLLLDDLNLICLCKIHHSMADRGEIKQKTLFELAKKRENNPPGVS